MEYIWNKTYEKSSFLLKKIANLAFGAYNYTLGYVFPKIDYYTFSPPISPPSPKSITKKTNVAKVTKPTATIQPVKKPAITEVTEPEIIEKKDIIKNVVIICGVDEKQPFTEEINSLKNKLEAAGAKVTLIGDSITPFTVKDVKEAIKAQNNEDMTIILYGHGGINKDNFYFHANKKYYIYSKDLFRIIKTNSSAKQIDYFLASCESGAAIDPKSYKDLSHSNVFALGGMYENKEYAIVKRSMLKNFINTIPNSPILNNNNGFSAENMFLDYAITDLKIATPATVLTKKGKKLNLNKETLSKTPKIDQNTYETLRNTFQNSNLKNTYDKMNSVQGKTKVNIDDFGKQMGLLYMQNK